MIRKKKPHSSRPRRRRLIHTFIYQQQTRQRGFSLVELIVGTVLTSIVIFLAWAGLIWTLSFSNTAQAKTARVNELIRAQDIMISEIREAQSVNQSGSLQANGATVSMIDVVAKSGITLNDLGNYGDIALYLELPTNASVKSCPTDTGSIPADPIDRVIYDIRPSPPGWLEPKAISRYGRIPSMDGSIDPCSKPVANDIIADSVANTASAGTCNGVISGSDGFRACMKGESLNLLMKSSINGVDSLSTQSHVTTRAVTLDPLDEMASTLKSFRQAFELYHQQNGQFPNDTHLTLPPGMDGLISNELWVTQTPLGGNYNWEGLNGYPYAGIAIEGATASTSVIAELDKRLDDGNLSTGNFRFAPTGRYTWIFEGGISSVSCDSDAWEVWVANAAGGLPMPWTSCIAD